MPTLLNLFSDGIMQKTLHDDNTFIPTDGRPVYNLCFTNDIDLMRESNIELQDLSNKLFERAGAYGMELSKEI